MASKIKTVGVVATGVIGSAFTALFLARGLRVIVASSSASSEEKLRNYLTNIWPSLESTTSLSSETALNNLTFVTPDFEGYWDEIDFVQENVPEKLDIKTRLFGHLDAKLRPGVPIVSSTSGFPSSTFIGECKDPGRVLIGHPITPILVLPLVEVVPHPNTKPEVTELTMDFYRLLGKKPILVRQETPGFIVNRLQAAVALEAFSLVTRDIVTAEEIDICMTSSIGLNWSVIGPFMSIILAGGGTPDGFSLVMQHLAPASLPWLADMRANSIDIGDSKNIDKLGTSVAKMLEAYDMSTFAPKIENAIVEVLKIKKKLDEKK